MSCIQSMGNYGVLYVIEIIFNMVYFTWFESFMLDSYMWSKSSIVWCTLHDLNLYVGVVYVIEIIYGMMYFT